MPSILVIDDHAAVLQSLELFLQFEGHTVLLALDGPTGLRLAAEHPVDVVLLDVEMPQMSGIAVCQAIKDSPALSHIPVIMMTGRPLRDLVARARAAGAAEVLAKPFDLEHLRQTLAGAARPPARASVAMPEIN